jgi:hypothetical protein
MNIQIVELLEQFRQKAGAWQSQHKAVELKEKLKDLLPHDDYWQLVIAHSHYLTGEGTDELYKVCKNLISKYRGGQDRPLSHGKTFV